MSDSPSPATGCTLCVQRITGVGFPSYCSDFSRDASDLGRLIKPCDITAGPAWCPKKGPDA